MANITKEKNGLSLFELVIFAMFASIMFISKALLAFLPNVHMLGMFTMLLTVVYRKKALIPLYIYVLLEGVSQGFSTWWLPYLYIFTILWAVTMLLPKDMSKKKAMIIYPIVCMSHGLLFGTLYAPMYALIYQLSFEQTIAWIVSGLPFDLMHGVGNVFFGLFVYPLKELILKLNMMYNKSA